MEFGASSKSEIFRRVQDGTIRNGKRKYRRGKFDLDSPVN